MCTVDITVMPRTTDATRPRSYAQLPQSTRSCDSITDRASTTGPEFVDLHVLRSKPDGFVLQERAGDAPGRIVGRASKTGCGELRTGHVAHRNQPGSPRNGGCDLMRPVFARVGDLGMEGLGTLFLPGSLDLRKRFGIVPRDVGATERLRQMRTRDLVPQAQINAYLRRSGRTMQVRHLTLEADVPPAATILREAAGFHRADEGTGEPQAEAMAAIGDRIASQTNTGGFEGNPALRTLATAPFQFDLLELATPRHIL